ncbi:hypothetical protein ZYGR_0N01950 [Zygosaccharomyces rouxii]|uniref:ZYRO0D04840p n=2 Tax=Zygosaccharomyces rouxii TaxID=4956 RepID=C5DV91_ZYGRC|nr:uncharacterized protein ZYRO0D04840g [Zygosaccharomyces rouxii]KAH9200623.1 hypothetical protein LQ764DRAFT_209005 [Zygosaccharomyces rouxii]GAV48790.1 hypothetical protein ZYGR_0N01950 [Zygosaccharomyces rouxii]CAR27710.1 ZYRO0D04840p [Zygosaccharomyces rouxii]
MFKGLLARREISVVQRRFQSYVHPVSKLGLQLQSQLSEQKQEDADKNTSTIYRSFKESLESLNETNSSSLHRSFGLNAPLTQLLKRSSTENGSYVEPFQILNTMCQFELARSHHFEIVLTHLIGKNLFQDAIALWVKYLECIAENPFTISQSSANRNENWQSHESNLALATLAYTLLSGNVPDLQVLKSILQLDSSKHQTVPFGKAQKLAKTIIKDPAQSKIAQDSLSLLFRQHVASDKASFLSQLDGILQLRHLKDFYSAYHSSKSTSDDPEILCKFMDKFIELNKPLEAITIYNQHKSLDSSALQNELLIAVAALQSNNRQLKLDRILAIWNSMIKANANADSYAALIRALGVSGHVNQLQSIYEKEIPKEFKDQPVVLEPYLTSLVHHGKISHAELSSKLPPQIKSVSLVNAVLLQMVRDDVPQEEWEKFYQLQFVGGNAPHRPTTLSLAIRMWANWKSGPQDKKDFQFLKSISISSRDFIKTNSIIEHFIEIVPNVYPIRALFEQIKLPLDSRKYALFLQSEFLKKNGDYQWAEDIFKEYLTNCKDQLNKLDRFVIEPMINGFDELAILQQDSSFLLKVSVYQSLADKLNVRLSNQCLAKTLHAAAMLSRVKSGKFSQNEQEFLNDFLQKLSISNDFKASPKDLDSLRQSNVSIPSNL